MFKKPKRQFRALRTRGSDSDEECQGNGNNGQNSQEEFLPNSAPQPMEIGSKKKGKKKDKSSGGITASSSSSSLSFDTHDDDEPSEVFRVKKSSRSQRIAKQLKKESRKEKEEREKREAQEQKHVKAPDTEEISNGKAMADMDLDSDNEGTNPEPSPPSLPSPEKEEEEDEKGPRRKFGPGKDFTSVLQSGQIPDANMIHQARKRRQMAREAGDVIPLEEEIKFDKTASRLIREEDHDRSDSDDEPILMTGVRNKEVELRSRRNKFYEAEQGSGEESDHETREWEEQQIRKGVSIPQVIPPVKDPVKNEMMNYQYAYGQTSTIFNPNAPPAMGMDYRASFGPAQRMQSGGLGMRMGVNPPTELPLINMEQIRKRLSERLESLNSLHRAHCNEKDDVESRLELCDGNIAKFEMAICDSEEQYKFFQEMRGYVRDLVECLNEKVPQVTYLERCMMHLMKTRADKLVRRRQEDIKDQSQDLMSSQYLILAVLNGSLEVRTMLS